MGKEYDIKPIISYEAFEENRIKTLQEDKRKAKEQKKEDILFAILTIGFMALATIIYTLIDML